jgi:hypothetical protein
MNRVKALIRDNNKTLLFFTTLLVISSAGWFGDAVKGDCLFQRKCTGLDWLGMIISLIIYTPLTLWTYKLGRDLLAIKVLGRSRELKPKKACIVFISTASPGIELSGATFTNVESNKTYTLTGDLQNDIKNLGEVRTNFQQLLRAIQPHFCQLTQVSMIASEKSEVLMQPYSRLLKLYKPTVSITHITQDFENLDALLANIKQEVGKYKAIGLHEHDIMLDVTGGQKTASIAAAMATLHNDGLEFQYVSTQPPFDVWQFNAVSQNEKNVAG